MGERERERRREGEREGGREGEMERWREGERERGREEEEKEEKYRCGKYRPRRLLQSDLEINTHIHTIATVVVRLRNGRFYDASPVRAWFLPLCYNCTCEVVHENLADRITGSSYSIREVFVQL